MIKTDELSEVFLFVFAYWRLHSPCRLSRAWVCFFVFFGRKQNKFDLCHTFQAPASAITASCASLSRCSCCKLFIMASFLLAFGRATLHECVYVCIISFESINRAVFSLTRYFSTLTAGCVWLCGKDTHIVTKRGINERLNWSIVRILGSRTAPLSSHWRVKDPRLLRRW